MPYGMYLQRPTTLTDGNDFWNNVEVLVILLFHGWHGLRSSDRQLRVGKGRTMQDLLCKYVALFSVPFMWLLNVFGGEMAAFNSIVFIHFLLQLCGHCLSTGAKGAWSRKESSSFNSNGIFTSRNSVKRAGLTVFTLFNHYCVLQFNSI
jgi:hypothetical protein